MTLCDVGSISIYYERTSVAHDSTSGDASYSKFPYPATPPTLLFVHGVGGAVETWIAMRSFFRKYDCIFIDLPGHGRSTGPPLTVSENATVLSEFIRQLQLSAVTYVGISYGSSVGLELALQHCDVMRAFVLMSPRTHFSPSADNLAAVIESIFDGQFVVNGAGASTSATMIAGMQRGMQSTPAATITGLFAKYNGYDVRGAVAQIDVPTLIISGTDDGISNRDDAIFLQHTVPGARLIQLDTGHFIPIEAPRDAARAIKEFV